MTPPEWPRIEPPKQEEPNNFWGEWLKKYLGEKAQLHADFKQKIASISWEINHPEGNALVQQVIERVYVSQTQVELDKTLGGIVNNVRWFLWDSIHRLSNSEFLQVIQDNKAQLIQILDTKIAEISTDGKIDARKAKKYIMDWAQKNPYAYEWAFRESRLWGDEPMIPEMSQATLNSNWYWVERQLQNDLNRLLTTKTFVEKIPDKV